MLYLARHGRTAWTGVRYCGRSDPPLDARGRRDATRLAHELAPVAAAGAAILSSPLRRALESARLIAADATVTIDARLVEVDFGMAEGLTFDELQARWPDLSAALLTGAGEIDWPGGESVASLHLRVAALCRDLRSQEDAIVVTHGFVARAIACELGADLPFLRPGQVRALAA